MALILYDYWRSSASYRVRIALGLKGAGHERVPVDLLAGEQEARDDWYRHWVRQGFEALEALAAPRAGRFLFGDGVTLADVCLVPQMYNARRFDLPLEPYPTLVHADAEASALDAFAGAH